MQFKTKLLSASMLAAFSVGSAQAVNLSPNGTGQVLIYPYYTATGNNQSLFTIRNTTDRAKAVKIRFREAKTSQEVLDFNVYLSPFDVWSAAIVKAATANSTSRVTAGAGKMLLGNNPDKSCTAPLIAATYTSYSSTATSEVGFTADIFAATAGSPTASEIAQTLEGYIEVIEMGEISPYTELVAIESATSTNKYVGFLSAVTHSQTTGKPLDCPAVDQALNIDAATFVYKTNVFNAASGSAADDSWGTPLAAWVPSSFSPTAIANYMPSASAGPSGAYAAAKDNDTSGAVGTPVLASLAEAIKNGSYYADIQRAGGATLGFSYNLTGTTDLNHAMAATAGYVEAGLLRPGGGLAGQVAIVDPVAGIDYSYDAIALDNFSARPLHFVPGFDKPSLADVNPKTSNLYLGGALLTDTWENLTGNVAATVALGNINVLRTDGAASTGGILAAVAAGADATASVWASRLANTSATNLAIAGTGIASMTGAAATNLISGYALAEPIEALLMASGVTGEYVLDTALAAGTDWVVNFPTKHYHQFKGLYKVGGTGTATTMYTVTLPFSCKGSADVVPGSNASTLDTGSAKEPHTNGCQVAGAPSAETISLKTYDREEKVTGSSGAFTGFSPLPSTATSSIALSFESNVLTFNNSNVLGSLNTYGIASTALPSGAYNGWARLRFTQGSSAAQPDTNAFTQYIDGSVNRYLGLPVIGFTMQKYGVASGTGTVNYGGINALTRIIDVAPIGVNAATKYFEAGATTSSF